MDRRAAPGTLSMVSPDVFAGYVGDALAHLYDRAFLRTHPLRSLLGSRQPMSEDELRRLLLSVVEAFRPPPSCPPSSPAWRGYRYLELRYLKGATPEQTARELQLSVRQAQRERNRALDGLAAALWERYDNLAAGESSSSPTPARESDDRRGAEDDADPTMAHAATEEAVQDELTKFGSLPSTEPVSLADAMRDALDIVARMAEDRGACVDLVFPGDLPPVRVHRLVLRQVLIDVLESAIESRSEAPIRVRAVDLTQTVSLELSTPRDGSTAVSPSPEIGARFVAMRKLIELQAGQLEIGRRGDLAFQATLSLPVTRLRTILVIDDNPDVAFLFSRLLRNHSYRILHASTGPSSLRLAREARPDVITLDVLMPAQDGWDLLRTLNADPDTRHIPVIVCSVLPERSLALSLGVAGFLDKPVTREALLAELRRCDASHGPS